MGGHELDTSAVQQDAATVHALATRAFDEVDMRDPAVAALAAWAAEIDAGIDDTTRFVMPEATPGSSSIALPGARGRRSALIAGSTVFALVVSGGAAAAVTGDPLAIVRAPLHAMDRINPFVDSEPNARDGLPKQVPATAGANKLLVDARQAMAEGDTATAQALLAEAEALLGDDVNPGQLNRIDKLKGDLPGQSGSHSPPNDGPKPAHDPKGKGPGDKPAHDPKGKGPGDKPAHDPKGKGPNGKQTTKPSGGSSNGGSGKPRKDHSSSKGGSVTPGKHGSDTAAGGGSSKPSHPPKSNPKG